MNIPLWSFLIIASGALACVVSGIISIKFGARRIAFFSLMISGTCCLLSPIFLLSGSVMSVIAFLFIWGLSVIADSPLFSTLIAQTAPPASKGTSLTIVNCIGFTITIISIQFINLLSNSISIQYVYMFLAIGPFLGLLALWRNRK